MGAIEIDETITCVGSYIAIMDVGNLIFNHLGDLGSGAVKLDLTVLTLRKILDTVKRIENKLDKIMQKSLKTAFNDITSAFNHYTNQSYERAYEILKDHVIPQAREAFNTNFNGNEQIEMATFECCMTAIKFLVFAQVLVNSYDEKEKFRPFHVLPKNMKKIIQTELALLVADSVKLKEKVNISKYYYKTDMIKVEKARKELNSVLRTTYPYISEAEGWTKIKRQIPPESSVISIKVSPKYLPFDYEDATTVRIGIKADDTDDGESIVTANIWRSNDDVFATVEGLEEGVFNKLKIEEEKSVIDFNIILKTHFIVLDTKDNQEAKKIGNYLGTGQELVMRLISVFLITQVYKNPSLCLCNNKCIFSII